MPVDIDLQIACDSPDCPSLSDITQYVEMVCQRVQHENAEVTVRIVETNESQELNAQYRNKDKPTNVLSFPSDLPDFIPSEHIGDLVICHDVVVTEAHEQQKNLQAHYAHMIMHGTLHLLGFDHINEEDAIVMEQHEVALLAQLGIDDPYNTD